MSAAFAASSALPSFASPGVKLAPNETKNADPNPRL